MTDSQLLEHIDNKIKAALRETFDSFGIAERIKTVSEQNTFKKVEQILWNYPLFKQIIWDKEEQIVEVQEHGLRTKSPSITEYSNCGGGTVQGLSTVQETVQGVVQSLVQDILWLTQTIEKIDLALDKVRESEHYDILESYYFRNESRDSLAARYGVDVKTISRRKSILVRTMAIYLFPQEVVTDIME